MLLPVLRPASWAGLRSGARAHVWLGSPRRPTVVVAYAWHRGTDGLSYVTKTSPHGDDDRLVRVAFDNLESQEMGFELVEADGAKMLVSAGLPLAAEHVLSENHMLAAHEQLDTDEIVVSITHDGLMLACAKDGGEQVRHTMTKLHRESFQQAAATGEQIFDRLIVLREGSVADVISVGADGNGHLDGWDRSSH